METNWNQLIERYLQNELSEEGRSAFEQELQVNSELREELEMHQLIQSAAKRASQRLMVKQVGKSYLRNLRIKQFAVGVVVTAAATVGIIYAVQTKKAPVHEPNPAEVVITAKEFPEQDTLLAENQPGQPGDKSSLIPSSDWQPDEHTQARSVVSHKLHARKGSSIPVKSDTAQIVLPLKSRPIKTRTDSVQIEVKTPSMPERRILSPKGSIADEYQSAEWEWVKLYDTVGHFNDLYCGYALVMSNAKIGFVDRKGNLFIPLIYDQIVVTTSIQSSKNRHKRRAGKVLYIPKRSGNEVQYCEDDIHPFLQADSIYLRRKK